MVVASVLWLVLWLRGGCWELTPPIDVGPCTRRPSSVEVIAPADAMSTGVVLLVEAVLFAKQMDSMAFFDFFSLGID